MFVYTLPVFIKSGFKPSFNARQLKRLVELAGDPLVTFIAVPTPTFAFVITHGTHEFVRQMPINMRKKFHAGINIDALMIFKWLNNEIDKRNNFILNNCNIHVQGLNEDTFK